MQHRKRFVTFPDTMLGAMRSIRKKKKLARAKEIIIGEY